MTTAARVAVGRSARRPGAATSMTPMAIAPTTEVSCVCAPAASATGVRDALLLIGMPDRSPVARLAAPRATSSRSWSTSSPRRIENVRDRTLVSVADTSAIPRAAGTSARKSPATSGGRVTGGSPTGSGPTTSIPARAGQLEDRAHDGRADDRHEDARDVRSPPAEAEDHDQAREPDRQRGRDRRRRRAGPPRNDCPASSSVNRPSVVNPNSLGSWLTMTISAMPLR